MKKVRSSKQQVEGFKKLARELDCDDSEQAFDAQLGKIGKVAVPQKAPRTRSRKKRGD